MDINSASTIILNKVKNKLVTKQRVHLIMTLKDTSTHAVVLMLINLTLLTTSATPMTLMVTET